MGGAGKAQDRGALERFLREHGFQPVRLERIPTGKFNDSYFVSTAEGREVVLRVAPPDDAGFLFYERGMMAQEPGVHRLVRQRTAIPVAWVLVYDDSRSIIDRDALVMERLEGRALSDIALSPAAAERVLEQVGRHLRDLHDACRAERYGYLGEHRPMAPAASWAEAFRTMWALLVDDIRACGAYDADEARTVRDALEPHLPLFDRQVPSCLLHMDVWAQNILVSQGGEVSGLVDWDRALWGDVEIEFAVLDYCGISRPSFWRGYGRPRDTSPAAQVRGVFYYLYELQKYIVIRTLRGRDPAAARRYKAHAARMLAELERRG
ncbi:MAG: phosphotransferase family protein [Candidatus Brocadiia bacterium]